MIEIVELIMILLIAGIAFWIGKVKASWSIPKKVVITITVTFGLMAGTFIGIRSKKRSHSHIPC